MTAETQVAVPSVGEALYYHWQFEALPVGSKVVAEDGQTYEKIDADNIWNEEDGSEYGDGGNFALSGYNHVLSIPGESAIQPGLTLKQQVWKVRSTLMPDAQRVGVAQELWDILEELEVGIEQTPYGTGVTLTTQYERDQLPVGSTYEHGDPDIPDGYGYWVVTEEGHRRVIGAGAADAATRVTIHLYEGREETPDWVGETPTEDDERAIAVWMAKMYRAGKKVQEKYSWCPTYDTYAAKAGLVPEVLTAEAGVTQPQGEVTRRQARELSEGTILRWVGDEDGDHDEMWFVRDNAASNVSGTRLVMGHRDTGRTMRDYAVSMTVMAQPVDEAPDRLPGWVVDGVNIAWLITYAPVGTVFTYASTTWAVCANETAREWHQWQDDPSVYDTAGWAHANAFQVAEHPTSLRRIGVWDG